MKAPIRYSADVEEIKPDEQEAIDSINESMRYIIAKTHEDLGHAERGVHAKSHALLTGELIVHEGLPVELAQGHFSEGGRRYPLMIRISSIPGDPLRDSVSLPRGFALKMIGVDGDRLDGAEAAPTQDFLFATAPAFAAPDAAGFARNLSLIAKTTDRVEWAKAAMSWILRPMVKGLEALGIDAGALKAIGGYPEINPVADRYYTQVPLRFGDYIGKFDIVPASDNFTRLVDERIDLSDDPDILRQKVADVIEGQGGEWTLRVQLCRDLEDNPIEDASVAWPEQDNPYLPIATIRVLPQTSWSNERSREIDDQTAFKPWNGVEAHRPLGNVMRARRQAYPVSADYRSQLTGCPIHEPTGLPRLD